MKRTSREPSDLSDSLHRRLNSYALAASAAGVSLMALARPAEAKIIYTRTHYNFYPGNRYMLDLNNDGVVDFVIVDFDNYCSDLCQAALNVEGEPLDSNGIAGKHKYPQFYAEALRTGARIGGTRAFGFLGATMVEVFSNLSHSYTFGYWVNVRDRYLGLKFVVKGKIHYGWTRMSDTIHGHGGLRSITASLTGYAYETIPEKPIIAGKTKGPDVITLQDASLGHLARGASAIPSWRATEGQ